MSLLEVEKLLKPLLKKDLSDEEKNFIDKRVRQILSEALKSIHNPFIFKALTRIYGQDFMKDLSQEFLLKLYHRVHFLQTKVLLTEAYLVKMAKNLIYYLLAKERILIISEEVPTLSSSDPESVEQVIYFDHLVNISYVNDYLRVFPLEGIIQALRNNLTEKEWMTLCYYLLEDEQRESLDLSKREKKYPLQAMGEIKAKTEKDTGIIHRR